jgi:hypothetical protein
MTEKLEDMFDDEGPYEIEVADRFEDHDEGSLSSFEMLTDIQTAFTEKQVRLMRGEIPMEALSFLDWNKAGTPSNRRKPLIPYLPIGWYIDSMNCLFGAGRWKLQVLTRERIRAKKQGSDEFGRVSEVYIEAKLVINDEDGKEIISHDCEGGALIRDNPNSTLADSFKAARSDALKNACQWLGLGLALKDKRFTDRALEWKKGQK